MLAVVISGDRGLAVIEPVEPRRDRARRPSDYRGGIWNWPIGIANNLLFIALFYKSGLYADMGLQFFYIAIGLYAVYQVLCVMGLVEWLRALRAEPATSSA